MRFQVLAIGAAVAVSSFTHLLHAKPVQVPVAVAEEGHKHGAGEKHKLGRQTIGGYVVSVIMIGEAEPGTQTKFDIKLIDAKSDPKALRVWIGIADGKGSIKADGKKGATTYAVDVKVPSPLPEGAKVWVELETDAGTTSASYAIVH